MGAQYTFSTFTPGEAETITGLSTTMQRDWRRRGFLFRGDGHARFDAFDLAHMLAMKALADRGIGPQTAHALADWCALGVCWQALSNKAAYEGDHELTFEWEPANLRPARVMTPEAYSILAEQAKALGRSLPAREDLDMAWGAKSEWLRKQIVRLKGFPRILPQRFLVWWTNDDHVFADSLDSVFDGMTSDDARVSGPVIVLDFGGLASQLLDRSGRPLIHVEFPTDPETGEVEQPIQYGAPVPLRTTSGASE